MQRVGVLVELPRLLRDHGVDPGPLLQSSGVDAALLSDPENYLSMEAVCDLAASCTRATGKDGFWMRLGAEVAPKHMGLMGTLMASAPSLRAALEDIVLNHPRYVRGGGPYLMSWGEGGLLIAYRTHAAHPRTAHHMARGAMAFGYHLFRQISGATPSQVLVSLPRPPDVADYAAVFGKARLVFGSPHFGLVYDKAALVTPMIAANPALRRDLLSALAAHLTRVEPSLEERLMRALVPSVLAGGISIAEASARLGMTPATLNRELRRQGTSYRSLLNAARYEMAEQLLLDARMSIAEIAQTLGYSEVSAFTRFFAARAGTPPAEWRAAALAEEGARLAG